jgi:hypothetical protein
MSNAAAVAIPMVVISPPLPPRLPLLRILGKVTLSPLLPLLLIASRDAAVAAAANGLPPYLPLLLIASKDVVAVAAFSALRREDGHVNTTEASPLASLHLYYLDQNMAVVSL